MKCKTQRLPAFVVLTVFALVSMLPYGTVSFAESTYSAENSSAKIEILSADFYDSAGLSVSYISEGEFCAGLSLTSDTDSGITVALASFKLDDNSFCDVMYETFNVTKGENRITTGSLYSDGSVYFRLFVWNQNLKPIKPDILFTTREKCGIIYSAMAAFGGESYMAEVNPETMVISFDLPTEDLSALENAALSFEANGGVTPGYEGDSFNITAPVSFSVLGESGESTVYSVVGEASKIARMYDVTGAKIYTSEEAETAWGGSYRSGTPKWISTEKDGGGAWFIEADGADSGEVSILNDSGNDYILLSKHDEAKNFVLWSGDNKTAGLITKLRTSMKFTVDSFTESYGQFAGFISGSGDEIVLTGMNMPDGTFTLCYRPRGQELKYFESSPVLETGKWYDLTFVFRRVDTYSTDSGGLYNGFYTEVYLDGEYIGTTKTSSNLPPAYVGYITMKDFSDSTYSQLSLQLHSGATANIGVDNILVTYIHTEDVAPQTECGAGQKVFLASYFASLGK